MERENIILNYLAGDLRNDQVTWIEDQILLDPAFRNQIIDKKLELFISDEINGDDGKILTTLEKEYIRKRILTDEEYRDKAADCFEKLTNDGMRKERVSFTGFIDRLVNKESLNAPEASKSHLEEYENRQQVLLSDLKDSLSSLRKEYYNTSITNEKDQSRKLLSGKVDRNFPKWAVAAGIALFIGIGSYVWLNIESSQEDYFASYYEPYELKPNKIDNYAAYTDAFKSYNQGDFEQAQKKLSEVVTRNNNYLTALFYLGVSSIETNEMELAISSLKKVSESNSIHFMDAKWYLALCYVKTNQMKMAKPLLKDIVKLGNTKYQEQASKLLGALS